MNEDVRLTYIENVVNKLKRGIYPASNLDRLKRSLIKMNFYNELQYKKIIDGYKSISE